MDDEKMYTVSELIDRAFKVIEQKPDPEEKRTKLAASMRNKMSQVCGIKSRPWQVPESRADEVIEKFLEYLARQGNHKARSKTERPRRIREVKNFYSSGDEEERQSFGLAVSIEPPGITSVRAQSVEFVVTALARKYLDSRFDLKTMDKEVQRYLYLDACLDSLGDSFTVSVDGTLPESPAHRNMADEFSLLEERLTDPKTYEGKAFSAPL